MNFLGSRDHVSHFDDMLDARQCQQIISMFEASERVKPGQVFHSDKGHEKNQDKISFDLEILPDGDSADSYQLVHNAVCGALELLVPKLPSLQVYPLQGTGYKIQKYPRNKGRFDWHFDALGPKTQNRLLALILYLNDVSVGGETAFYYQENKVIPKAGYGIFFPTSWTHMHSGVVPESGDKYIVSSFFYYSM